MGDKGLRVSYGKYVYEHVSGWGSLPDGWEWNHAVGVAVDGQDRIFVYNRSAHPIIVLDTDGNVINHWGEGLFGSAHHIEAGPDGSLYTTDIGDHTVRKWTAEGELLMMLGTPNDPPEMFSGEPFNRPTDIAIAGDGSLYISDGYGNARIHHFTATGELIKSWGEPGEGPGQFRIPHGICISAEGLIYVVDRENSRIQVFTPDGQYLSEWGGVHRPDHIVQGPDGNMFVTDLGFHQGLGPDQPQSECAVASGGGEDSDADGPVAWRLGHELGHAGRHYRWACGCDGLEWRPVCGRDAGRGEGAEVRAGCVAGTNIDRRDGQDWR